MARARSLRLEPPAARHWDFPRSVAALTVVVDFAAAHGVAAGTVLDGTGVGEAALADPAALVPASAELAALRNLRSAMPGRVALGVELGARYHVTSFGILGFALLSSRTLLDAMNLALRFLDLSYAFSSPAARVVGEEVVVELDAAALPPDLARLLVERDAAAVATVLAELVPGGTPLASVELAFPAPRDAARHEALLGSRVRFDRPATLLRIGVDQLHRRLPQGNPHSQALAEELCRQVVAGRRGSGGLVEELRLWLTRNVAHDVTMATAAAAHAMSTRTLRRRLTEAGTSYQALLDEVRRSLAEEMLGTGVLDVEDVAQRLGYAEASSFVHAFKRWRGVTPARFRRDLA
ncbi:AraC family transcriptional regulator [Nocardioides caldifontis]|uniref:AraC family transcriptional regulator n=1 Tax=Nocardioides caldifontis TaxID=2588938 RepID=UPI0011E04164|nr:AraC family transcriptional regulator [Nocardioides caldifontis]